MTKSLKFVASLVLSFLTLPFVVLGVASLMLIASLFGLIGMIMNLGN